MGDNTGSNFEVGQLSPPMKYEPTLYCYMNPSKVAEFAIKNKRHRLRRVKRFTRGAEHGVVLLLAKEGGESPLERSVTGFY